MTLRRAACTGGGFLVDGDAPVGANAPSGGRARVAGGVGLAACIAVLLAVLVPRLEDSPDEISRISIAAPRAVVVVLDQPGGRRSAPTAPSPQSAATVRLPEEF